MNRFRRVQSEEVLPFTIPLFRRIGDGVLDFEGSGVLLTIRQHHFLVSAAHVFDALQDGIFLLADGRERYALTNKPTLTDPPARRPRAYDEVDIGFVRLEPEELEALGPTNFFRLDDVEPPIATYDHEYMAVGYPQRDQERIGVEYTFKLGPRSYRAPEAEEKHYQRTKTNSSTHLLMHYDQNRIEGPHGVVGTGPSMTGYSGGGIWRYVATTDAIAPPELLVAIFLGYPTNYKQSLVGTRISVVRELLPASIAEVSSAGSTSAR